MTWWLFKKDFIIYLERGEGKEKERERRETSLCGCPSRVPNWGPGLQPRHVPWLGIEPVIFCFTGPCSIHWAIPARAGIFFIYLFSFIDSRERRREKERERIIAVRETISGCLAWPQLGTQPRHVPWSGIEPVTFWFVRQCLTN